MAYPELTFTFGIKLYHRLSKHQNLFHFENFYTCSPIPLRSAVASRWKGELLCNQSLNLQFFLTLYTGFNKYKSHSGRSSAVLRRKVAEYHRGSASGSSYSKRSLLIKLSIDGFCCLGIKDCKGNDWVSCDSLALFHCKKMKPRIKSNRVRKPKTALANID